MDASTAAPTTTEPAVAATTLDTLTLAALAARAGAAAEPDWLAKRRQAAVERFDELAWPDSRVDEFWRSTAFHRFVATDGPLVGGNGRLDHDVLLPPGLGEAVEGDVAHVHVVDGEVVEVVLPASLAEQGLVVESLAVAASGPHAALVERHLGSLTATGVGTGGAVEGGAASEAGEDRTIVANDAAWTAGVFVHVPKELVLTTPIDVRIHATVAGTHLPRVLVVAERHSQASLYLQHTDAVDGATLVDEVVELVLEDGAQVDVVSFQEWTDHVTHLSLQKAAVHRNATFRHLAVMIGGRTVRMRPEADLLGPGASAYPRGVYFADEGQHFDLQPYLRHIAPNATSDTLYKGALQGNSRTVFRGNVLIGNKASGTVTDENNRSLILTKGAKADATPFLEIYNHDVQAGHGSATGQVEGSYLWYLQSRGITRAEALRLIVFGFFTEVLEDIELPGVTERTLEHIEREIAETDLSKVGVSAPILPEG